VKPSPHHAKLIAAAALFSTGGAAVKATTLTSWQVAGFRSGVAALVLILVLPAVRRGWTWRVALVGVTYAATLILFVAANKLTTAANTIFLQATAPLYILLLGPLLLRESLRRTDLLFMTGVGSGLLLFFVGTEPPVATAPNPVLGNVLAALSGFCWALTVVGLRWLERRPEGGGSALATVGCGNVIAFLACLPAAIPVRDATALDWLTIVYLGVFQIGVAYLLFVTAIRFVTALEASLILLVEPALNPIWAWLLHAERPSAWAITGGSLILGATLLKVWWDGRGVQPVRAVLKPEEPG
jgi:drug/metabolite transporter, DME family